MRNQLKNREAHIEGEEESCRAAQHYTRRRKRQKIRARTRAVYLFIIYLHLYIYIVNEMAFGRTYRQTNNAHRSRDVSHDVNKQESPRRARAANGRPLREENDATIILSSRAGRTFPADCTRLFRPSSTKTFPSLCIVLFFCFVFHPCRSRDFIPEMILKAPKNGIRVYTRRVCICVPRIM